MLLAFALTVPMALTLSPAAVHRAAVAPVGRTGHIQAMDPTVAAFMNDADISAVQIFSGALTLSLAGALFMRGDLSSPETTTAPSKGMEMKKYTVTVKRSMREKKLFEKKIAELKREGEATIARREAAAKPVSLDFTVKATLVEDLVAATGVVGVVTPVRAAEVEAAFTAADTDGDGSIDAEELQVALVAAGKPSDEEAVRETMAALDTNKDGVISLDEMKVAPPQTAWWDQKPTC